MLAPCRVFAQSHRMATVHIIGAGVSGLAAATLLAERHVPVKLYEASTHAGGRCRSSQHRSLGTVDHGLYVTSPADTQWQRYLTRIGASDATVTFAAPPLPRAPLADYAQALLMLGGHGQVSQLPAENWLREGWLAPWVRGIFGQAMEHMPVGALRHQWRRLCRRHLAMAARQASEDYISPALSTLEAWGGSVYFGHALSKLEWDGARPTHLHFARKKIPLAPDDIIILAVPGPIAHGLLPSLPVPLPMQPAITVHFHSLHRETVPSLVFPVDAPMDMIRYSAERMSVSIRVATRAWPRSDGAIAAQLWRALQQLHPYLAQLPTPPHVVIREKQAGHTVAPLTPVDAQQGAIILAGDWLDPLQPATLEIATAHGHRAAELAMAQLPQKHRPTQQHFYLNSRN